MPEVVQLFKPKIWSARFQKHLDDNYVYAEMANRDYQGDIANVGDTVKVPSFTKSFSVGNYVENEDISAPETVTGSMIDLVIDKQKYFHFYIDDVDKLQSAPELMDMAMSRAGVAVAEQVDSDVRDEFIAGYAASREVEVAGTLEADTFGTNFMGSVIDTKEAMSKANIPMTDRWMIIPPETVGGLEKYFLTKPPANVFMPASTEDALRNGFMGTLLGFKVYVTNRAYEATVQNVDYWRIICGQGKYAVSHASQINNIETYRPDRRFGDAVKGLYVYGTKLLEADSLFFIRHAQSA